VSAGARAVRVALMLATALAAFGLLEAAPASARAAAGSSGRSPHGAVIPVAATGQLTVDFAGADGAGCEADGVCAYSGSVQWAPTYGTLFVLRTGSPRRRATQIELTLEGGTTSAQVQTSGAGGSPASSGTCLDQRTDAWQIPLALSHRRIRFDLTGSVEEMLGARCAGPRDRDVLGRLPVPSLTYAAALRGRTTVRLVASRRFTSGGFTGTISSTLRIRLGRPSGKAARELTSPLGKPSRRHTLAITYRATLSGSSVQSFSGDPDPSSCGPLASCGISGTLTLRPPTASTGTAFILADGPPRTPLAALRHALGLGGRAGARPPTVIGFVAWRQPAKLGASVVQGPLSCADSAPTDAGILSLQGTAKRLIVNYSTQEASDGAPITRCPGPAAQFLTLAWGWVPLRDLAARVVRVPLGWSSAFLDDGYSGRLTSALTLTLTRVRIRAREQTEPAPSLAELLL
jgi:hypothetical protein